MITCSHCQHPNSASAFFCKRCGHPVVCPRCRIVLEEPLNYCDNCGQLLVSESDSQIFAPSRPASHSRPEAKVDPHIQPIERGAPAVEAPVLSQGTRLEQFVPNELMAKLEAARTSGTMVGERRVVTILFCDVKDSTEAAEKLDPEDWTEIINGAFEHMIKPVYKYEGTLARLMGDGILAFFGAPITHEDDPQRAILAGLDIVSAIELYKERVLLEWGIELKVRVGINTGRVVVGAVGSDLRMEYTAMGDAINLASRMEQTATPGTIQVAYDTYKIVAPLFEFEELGGIEVKGKSAPIQAYRVIRRKAAPGRTRGIEGIEIDLIGRDLEMANLRSAVEDARHGVGGIICVLGEAGLGKSRLVHELQRIEAANEMSAASTSEEGAQFQEIETDIQWFDTASLSYETAQPYALFRRLIRRLNGISHNDTPSELREKLSLIASTAPPEEKSRSVSALEALFGLASKNGDPPLEGEAFKRALFNVMPALWRQQFADQPTIIVFDDLQWSDPASIDLLHDLLPLTEELAIIFLCIFRPNQDAPGWKIKNTADQNYHHRYTEINLRPLSVNQSNQMIDALLGSPELPEELRGRILEQAAGNPFFIEEVIRTLIDGEALLPVDSSNGHPRWRVARESADIHIPDNLQALLTARIDNLSEDVRQTLQVASVIGRNFYRRVLQLINETSEEMDSHLQTLLRQNMIRESARIPEVEYRFRNPLTQEAAYRTILIKHRREFHLRAGEVMETIFTEQLEEQAPRLAYHFREAHQYERAMTHYKTAGDVAYRLFANEEASTHYGDALEMARLIKEPVSSDILLHLYSRRGRALEHQVAYEAALENYQAMLVHARERQDQSLDLAAMTAMATIYSTRTPLHDPGQALKLSEEALVLAQSLDDRAAIAKINWNLLNTVAFTKGNMEEGLAYGETSLKIARELGLKEQIAFTLTSMIMLYWNDNQIAEGNVLLDEVRQLWRELDNQPMLADSYSMSGYSLVMIGDFVSALERFKELERISEAINNSWNLSGSKVMLGMCYLQFGEIDRGVSYMDEAVEIGIRVGLFANELLAKVVLAGAYALLGLENRAKPLSLESYQRRDEFSGFDSSLVLGLVAAACVRNGELSQANEIMEELSAVDTSSGSVWSSSYVVGAVTELALAEGRPDDAIEKVDRFLPRIQDSGVHSALPYLLYQKGLACIALEDLPSAVSSFEEALEYSKKNGERIWRWQILASLVNLASDRDLVETSQAVSWEKEAAETVSFISNHIQEPEFRGTFQLRSGISTGAGEIIQQ
jgi:class 3 adenylate cyclase/predicted ATPase